MLFLAIFCFTQYISCAISDDTEWDAESTSEDNKGSITTSELNINSLLRQGNNYKELMKKLTEIFKESRRG